jgi:hypothetical protein
VLNSQYVHVITDERTAARMTVEMSCIGNNHRTPCRYKPNLNPDLHPQCILAFQSATPFAGKDGGRYAYGYLHPTSKIFPGLVAHSLLWTSTLTSNSILTLSLVPESRLISCRSFVVADKLAFCIEARSQFSSCLVHTGKETLWHSKDACIAMMPLNRQIFLCTP